MRGKANFFILTILLMALTTGVMAADPPNSIVYQGRLADTSGTPITATVSVMFSIYSSASGGSALWDSTYSITPDANGIFTAELGPLANSVFSGAKRYLGIKVGADPEMTPRQLLTSAPYSFQSITVADASVTAASIASGAVTNTKIATGAVSEIKLAGNAVTTAKIASGAVGNSDLAINAVTGIKVLNSSLTKSDIADEPGIARGKLSSSRTIADAGVTNLVSASIAVPGSGYIVALAHCAGELNSGADGLIGNIIAGVETSATTSPTAGEYSIFGTSNDNIGANETLWGQVIAERTFAVSSAGTKIYYFNAIRGYSAGTTKVWYAKLLLTYYPTSYGTVSKIVSQDEATEFDVATPVSIDANPADPNSTSTVMYEVDLRELEIKALKAQLEAEEAQQKLDDARAIQEADSQKEN